MIVCTKHKETGVCRKGNRFYTSCCNKPIPVKSKRSEFKPRGKQ